METKDHRQGNKTMPENPKPSDEVQMHIETVTPETEKDALPNKDVTGEDSKDQTVNPEDSKDLEETEKSEDNTESSGNDRDIKETDEVSKDGENPDDTRDQVETINP